MCFERTVRRVLLRRVLRAIPDPYAYYVSKTRSDNVVTIDGARRSRTAQNPVLFSRSTTPRLLLFPLEFNAYYTVRAIRKRALFV